MVLQVYHSIARALGCIVLFFFANLLKTLAAKVMATSFHTEAHFQKMQEALQKVMRFRERGIKYQNLGFRV